MDADKSCCFFYTAIVVDFSIILLSDGVQTASLEKVSCILEWFLLSSHCQTSLRHPAPFIYFLTLPNKLQHSSSRPSVGRRFSERPTGSWNVRGKNLKSKSWCFYCGQKCLNLDFQTEKPHKCSPGMTVQNMRCTRKTWKSSLTLDELLKQKTRGLIHILGTWSDIFCLPTEMISKLHACGFRLKGCL